MAKPKILIFVDYYLPGYKFGGPIQSIANLVSILHEHYNVFIVTRDRDFGDTMPYEGIEPDKWIQQEHNHIIYLKPSSVGIFSIYKLIHYQLFDFIYANSLFGRFTRILLVISVFVKRKIIIAPRGELHPGAMSLKAYKKWPYVSIMQFLPVDRIIWHATDSEEIKSIKRVFTSSKIKYAPVRLAPDTPRLLTRRTGHFKQVGLVRLISVARITPVKNLGFLLRVLKTVWEGQIQLDLYGPVADTAYWRECETLIRGLPATCQVTYKNPLPHEKVSEVMGQYDFMILPTLGENFGHVIVEALSVGLPVIISDRTPWRDLTAKNAGWDIPLEPVFWIDTLQTSLRIDNWLYSTMSEQARMLANDYVRSGQFEQSYTKLFS